MAIFWCLALMRFYPGRLQTHCFRVWIMLALGWPGLAPGVGLNLDCEIGSETLPLAGAGKE